MKYISILFLSLTFLIACNLNNNIELDFPPHESVLVVESYLIPGKPYVVLLTETVSYNSSITATPKVNNAEVKIIYKTDTIQLFETTEGIYKSGENVPIDYESEFTLLVRDNKNREVTGKTKLAKPILIDSVKFIFNQDNNAATVVYFNDDDSIENFYRITFLYIEEERFNDKMYNGKSKPVISSYKMQEHQKLTILLLHVNKDCYDYFITGHNAYLSNVRPLIEPAQIKSNISGGIGIFTGISVEEKNVTVTR